MRVSEHGLHDCSYPRLTKSRTRNKANGMSDVNRLTPQCHRMNRLQKGLLMPHVSTKPKEFQCLRAKLQRSARLGPLFQGESLRASGELRFAVHEQQQS